MASKSGIGVAVALALLAWSQDALAGPTVITMNPDPVNVGNVLIGGSGMATGSLSDNNNDHVDLAVTSTCSGTGTGTFTLSPMTNVNLSSAKTITVTYTPATTGALLCTVNVYTTATTSKLGSFDVRGTGQNPPTISVTGTTAFGAVRFNNAAPIHTASQNFTVTNTGDVDLVISNVTTTGDFAITAGGTTATIPAGNTGTWTVTFDPSTAGSLTGTLVFTSNDPNTGTKTLNLTGKGSTGVIGVTDPSFGIVNTGSSSSLDITVSNNGAVPKGNLGVTNAVIAGGGGWFTFSACGGGTSCTFSPALSISASTVVGVTCSPPTSALANDMQTATVTFTSDTDGATPDNVSALSCTAGKSLLATNVPNVVFTGQLVGTPAVLQTVTVTNTGNVATTFYFRLTGASANNFGASTGSGCGTGAGNQCTVPANNGTVSFDVTFTPSGEGDISAGLDLVSGGAFPQLTLAGRGIDRHIMTAPSVMFPDTFRNPGDQATVTAVTINNIGEYPLHVSALAVGGAPIWTLADPTTTFDVPGLSSHDVMVRFSPVTAGKMPDGALAVTSDDRTNGMSTVFLVGNGKDRRVTMGPPTIDLGDTGAGVPTKLSAVRPDLLSVVNMDDMNTFHIRSIAIEGDNVFEIQNLDANAALAPSSTSQFDIVFNPPTIGEFHANVTLYLDQDPTAQVSVPIHGRALFVDAHGSGGCSTGGGAGGGMALLLGVLVLGSRRRRATVVVAGGMFASAVGHAAPTRNIDLTVFDPTPTTSSSSFQLQTADVGANGEYVATALASYASNPLVLGTAPVADPVVRSQTMMSIGGAYAFLDRFEAGARMPFYVQSGNAVAVGTFGVPPASGTARGDLTVHAKVRLVRTPALMLGAAIAVELPTATDSQFAGAAKPSARALALLSWSASPRFTVHLNGGAVLRAKAEFANIEQRSGLAWGAGATLRVADPLSLMVEAFGDVIPSGYHAEPDPGATMGATSALKTIEGLAGVRYQISRQLGLGVAAGRGLTSGIGTPDLRGVVMLAYAPSAPQRPSLHRVESAHYIATGKPDPSKADVDPSKLDSDVDRIPDSVDKCPTEPEDKDGFEDEDGCPDLDNDNDGVPDEKDKCPNVAEDKDGFEDDDGCPDPDNDKDGIPDTKDKCPMQPETINGNNDNDGCPDAGDALVISSPDRLELLEPVTFTGAAVSKKSANVLGQLAATLRARADIARIRITTHVQPTKHPDRDQALSDKRADAVLVWLAAWGIAADRLEAKGFGGTKPLVPAKSKGSALINDRLELIILDRK